MRKILLFVSKVLVLSMITGLSFSFAILNVNWNLDPNYSIKFKGSNAEGTFSGMTGTIKFDPSALEASKMDVSVDAATIKTGNDTKDKHAKGDKWFDVAKYPKISFKSTAFSKTSDGFLVNGDLKMRNVTKSVSIPFQFVEDNGKGRFSGTFKLKRKDYGIYGPLAGMMVGNDFTIELNVPVSR
jgi:polyisoprenoid-binding protein YceI